MLSQCQKRFIDTIIYKTECANLNGHKVGVQDLCVNINNKNRKTCYSNDKSDEYANNIIYSTIFLAKQL